MEIAWSHCISAFVFAQDERRAEMMQFNALKRTPISRRTRLTRGVKGRMCHAV